MFSCFSFFSDINLKIKQILVFNIIEKQQVLCPTFHIQNIQIYWLFIHSISKTSIHTNCMCYKMKLTIMTNTSCFWSFPMHVLDNWWEWRNKQFIWLDIIPPMRWSHSKTAWHQLPTNCTQCLHACSNVNEFVAGYKMIYITYLAAV